ncbi:MAG: Crp/Fnr family transcriptional regulator [Faecousia sp.]
MEVKDFFPVWNELTHAQQEKLAIGASKRAVQKGAVIHSGSLDCTGLLLVERGQLRAYILSNEGREITLYRLLDRDICLFSASCIMRSIQFEVMISAERETTLWVIPSEVYKSVMEQSAPLANFTNEVMADRFSDVMWLLEQILWKRFDQRLAGFLLEESALEGTNELKITHEAIGSHMGNPREVVTRMLRYFQSEGLVKLARGTIEITAPQKLVQLKEK